jgi:signal transduction histidine kinase
MNRLREWYQKSEKAIVISVASLFLSLFLLNLEFNFLESSLYDLRMRLGVQPEPSKDIVLIALDDYSAGRLDEFAPLPLDQHVRLLETLETFRPRGIGYFVDLNKSSQFLPEALQAEWNSRLISTVSRLESKGSPFLLGTSFDVNGEVVPTYPLSLLPHSIAVIHKDGNIFGEDKITRRALLSLYGRPTFHLEFSERLGFIDSSTPVRGQFAESGLDADYFFFRYHGPTAYSANAEQRTGYPIYSFIDIIDGKVGPLELGNKIILVGTILREDSNDFTFTPYSKRQSTNPKLVVHANILDAIMHQRGIVEAPFWFHFLVTFSLILFVIWSVFNYTPLYGVFNTISLSVGFLIVGQILFTFRGLWVREAQPIVGIFLSYYLTVPYRLIQEYKQRWDYQRKNDILIQVEELKTNFIRLVTHDLKTPVARIQGLAEMVLRKTQKKIDDEQSENLKHIVQSTEDLNHFISSILELTKIETNNVSLQLESKDINQLIEKSVERLEVQARDLGIEIQLELEPLFPIRLDVNLISKVLNNLIDNALKYSPSQSKITIRSEDREEFVRISVSDSGIGLTPEERQSLFTRFYRAKNDQTAKVSGTGLGLYLTKFFVEAHQGSVEVESVKGEGSTFSITLPTNIKSGLTVSESIKQKRSDPHVSSSRRG